MKPKKSGCVVCGDELPQKRRKDRRYCGVRCRVRAHRLWQGVGFRRQRKYRKARSVAAQIAGVAITALTPALLAQALIDAWEQTQTLAQDKSQVEDLVAQRDKDLVEVQDKLARTEEDRERAREATRKLRDEALALLSSAKQEAQELRADRLKTEEAPTAVQRQLASLRSSRSRRSTRRPASRQLVRIHKHPKIPPFGGILYFFRSRRSGVFECIKNFQMRTS